MPRSLSHTSHWSNTSSQEGNATITRWDALFASIGSRKIPVETTVAIPHGGYHIHSRLGAIDQEKPVLTNVKGVNGSNIIMVECHHGSERAKKTARAAKTVMGESPGVYHVSHGRVRMSVLQEKYLLYEAADDNAKISRSYASDSSDSGSDNEEVRRNADRTQLLFRRPITGTPNTGEDTFDDRRAAEAFGTPRISALQDTSKERKAARALRRARKRGIK